MIHQLLLVMAERLVSHSVGQKMRLHVFADRCPTGMSNVSSGIADQPKSLGYAFNKLGVSLTPRCDR